MDGQTWLVTGTPLMNLHDKDLLSTLLMHVWHINDAKSEAGCEGRRGLNLRAFATSDPSRRTCVVVFGLLLFVYYLDVNTSFSFYLAAVFIFLFFSFSCGHFLFSFPILQRRDSPGGSFSFAETASTPFSPSVHVGEAGLSQLVNKVGGEEYWTEMRGEQGMMDGHMAALVIGEQPGPYM